ncbi:MAG TPA: hypothetical protein VFX89_19105 [Gammaproteobacteria bacterium]|nr:hypothetical protein [Gammaproteobacteria bacterium]
MQHTTENPHEASLKGAGEELLGAIAQRARDVVELAATEARLAALSGLAMLVLVMVAAAALVIGWGLLVACVLYLFWRAEVGWALPALVFALAHGALAYYLWQTTARLSRNLTLPVLRREVLHAPVENEEHADVVAVVAGRP